MQWCIDVGMHIIAIQGIPTYRLQNITQKKHMQTRHDIRVCELVM